MTQPKPLPKIKRFKMFPGHPLTYRSLRGGFHIEQSDKHGWEIWSPSRKTRRAAINLWNKMVEKIENHYSRSK